MSYRVDTDTLRSTIMKIIKQLPLYKLLFTSIIFLAFCTRVWNVQMLSPYWEEVALGYDAYSILTTGKDHHGNLFPIVVFESFGDYKPSGYFYAVVPFVWMFGLNTFSVRLPSILAGVITVVIVGRIARFVTHDGKKKKKRSMHDELLPYITMFVFALSPWSIMFSRGAWEANLATLFLSLGVYFGFTVWKHIDQTKSERARTSIYLFLCAVFLIMSFYTYHATRIVAPLLGIVFVIPLLKQWKIYWKHFAVVGIMSLAMLTPFILSLQSDTVSHRLKETSIFSDISVIEQSNALIQKDGNTLLARIVHHRYILFARQILNNYLSHFRIDFLFFSGDQNPRHSLQYMGILYHIEFFFLLAGIHFSIRKWNKNIALIVFWIAIGIIPASLTKTTPHALRTLLILPAVILIVSFGIMDIWKHVSEKLGDILNEVGKKEFEKYIPKLVGALIIFIYLGQFGMFWHFYTRVYPNIYSSEWQYGYKEMLQSVETNKKENEAIYITREQGRPAMYYFFYNKIDPSVVQSWDEKAKQDQGEFLEFENIKFIKSVDEVTSEGLIVASPEQFERLQNKDATSKNMTLLSEIKNPLGKVVWVVGRGGN